ncbi:MAG: hypothetical protein KDJ88_11765 [Bauldia sp.]|nr:hypothetical protein [Bauldia sp.]
MRKTSFLAAVRSRDGRSIARALAIALLFNLFAAGLHTGAMAAGEGSGLVLCLGSSDVDGHGAPLTHWSDCCFTGCVTTPAALPVCGDVALFVPEKLTDRPDLGDAVALAAPGPERPRARGPPFPT